MNLAMESLYCPEPQYKGYHHVTWYVGNAKQAASYFITRFGFDLIAYQGLETGHRCVSSHVIANGDVVFVFSAPIRDMNTIEEDCTDSEKLLLAEIHEHLSKHGDAVKDVAFEVDNVEALYTSAVMNGAVGIQAPTTLSDESGELLMAVIGTYGDTTHTLVEKHEYYGLFMPGYSAIDDDDPILKYLPRISLETIDHCVGNQDWGGLQAVCD
jgi:4-hydroxyphenylpyruvate dioxygenase